jgi:hypothetical protein
MAIRFHLPLIAVALGLSLAHARPVAAADLRVASANSVSNNVEIDQFDSSGLFTDGFYLHTPLGNLGSGYFSAFAFDPAGNLRVASANSVSNNVEIDQFGSSGLFTDGFYLHTAIGNLGSGYFSGLAFDPAGNLRIASANSVSNNIEIDQFDSSGLFTDGFYLHTTSGNLGSGYFSGFAFDPTGNLWVSSANSVSNNVEIDQFDSTGLFVDGFYLHTASSNLGAGYYSDFDFAPSAATPAPEPATWSMMMIGFGLFAAISWRKAGLQRRRSLIESEAWRDQKRRRTHRPAPQPTRRHLLPVAAGVVAFGR